MTLRWEDERYVRAYTRDTADWLALSFDAQGLFQLLLRKVDRAGILRLGRRGVDGLAPVLGHPEEGPRIKAALAELLADGCVEMMGGADLLIPNFIEAQEAKASDAQRKRDQRERDRDKLVSEGQVLNSSGQDITATMSRGHTSGHTRSQPVTPEVTRGHTESHAVTPSLTSLAVPNQPSRAEPTPQAEPPKKEAVVGVLEDGIAKIFQEETGTPFEWKAQAGELRALVPKHSAEEVLRRWRIGLRTGYPRCWNIGLLVKHWDAYAKEQPGPRDKKPPANGPRGPEGEVKL